VSPRERPAAAGASKKGITWLRDAPCVPAETAILLELQLAGGRLLVLGVL